MKLKDCSIASRAYALIVIFGGKSCYKYTNEVYKRFMDCEVKQLHFENNTLWITVKEYNYE